MTPLEDFIGQFAPHDDDWLYRYKMTGAAYRVTDGERAAFIAMFERRHRWVNFVGMTVIVLLLVLFLFRPHSDLPVSWLGIAFIGGAFALGLGWRWAEHHFVSRQPLRALAKRAPVAPAWSRAARRQHVVNRISAAGLIGNTGLAALWFAVWGMEGWKSNSWLAVPASVWILIVLRQCIQLAFKRWYQRSPIMPPAT